MVLYPTSTWCNKKHPQGCLALLLKYDENINNKEVINDEVFNKFIAYMHPSGYTYDCCLKSNPSLITFLIKGSSIFKINFSNLGLIIHNLTDLQFLEILKNQVILDTNYINKLAMENNVKDVNSYRTMNFVILIANTIKYETFKFIMNYLSYNIFITLFGKIIITVCPWCELVICDYIKKNNIFFKSDFENSKKMMEIYINKPKVFKELYKILYLFFDEKLKYELLKKCLISLDIDLILMIIEGNNIKIDNDLFIDLLSKQSPYPHTGSSNKIKISEVIDLFIDYNLKINKEFVLNLISRGCYINNLEKYDIPIDNDIDIKCATHSYYPYNIKIKPCLEVIKIECSKSNNLDTIKKLKERGGIFTSECLAEACRQRKNGKIIKYLINECNVKVNDSCLIAYESIYGTDALDIIIKNYHLENKNNIEPDKKTNNNIELNKNCLMTVDPKKTEYKINNFDDLITVKKKIIKFFNIKRKKITYNELYKFFLEYLINNKLVIATYFIINLELSDLLKINICTIMHIDELKNILPYFIEETL